MRNVTLLSIAIVATTSGTVMAQNRWAPIDGRSVTELAVDRTSLQQVDSALQVDVRSSPGPLVYNIIRYQVRCRTRELRAISRAQYLADLNRPLRDSAGKAIIQDFTEGWFLFAPGSEGRILTDAICQLGRDQGLLG